MAGSEASELDMKAKLIMILKKEVKQIMEEAVTRKFIHEESSSVTSLCGAVESCLSHGLRRRALGLFKSSSTTALIQKIGKTFEPAGVVCKILSEMENAETGSRRVGSQDSLFQQSTSRPGLHRTQSSSTSSSSMTSASGLGSAPSPTTKYLWIRIALFEKKLTKIIDYLVQNCTKFYDRDAFVCDQDFGPILSSLLVGPCALDYSKLKTADHWMTDPPADELVQRHRMSSNCFGTTSTQGSAPSTPPTNRKLGLQYRRPLNGLSTSEDVNSRPASGHLRVSIPPSARDYVESLHQNNRLTLLYGKNNVVVQPRPDVKPLQGYLSLHQSAPGQAIIRWTPNDMMNTGGEEHQEAADGGSSPVCPPTDGTMSPSTADVVDPADKSKFWEYALNIKVSELVYLHCHQFAGTGGGTLALVGQDGVQRAPIHFPPGGHLLSFLSCLESGLAPNGYLDPPLWSERDKEKAMPLIRRPGGKSSVESQEPTVGGKDEADSAPETTNGAEENKENSGEGSNALPGVSPSVDYVFRIVTNATKPEDLLQPPSGQSSAAPAGGSLLTGGFFSSALSPRTPAAFFTAPSSPVPRTPRIGALASKSSSSSSTTTSKSLSLQESEGNVTASPKKPPLAHSGDSIQLVCDRMRHQIMSRAFCGWLAHCRHLKTVRKHLAGLVYPKAVSCSEPTDAMNGLTKETWTRLTDSPEGKIEEDSSEIYRLIYYGGVAPEIRREVWPFVMGHYQFGSTLEERQAIDVAVEAHFETTMSNWTAAEAIVKQREREQTARARRTLSSTTSVSTSSGSTSTTKAQVLTQVGKSMSNEVFEADADADSAKPSMDAPGTPAIIPPSPGPFSSCNIVSIKPEVGKLPSPILEERSSCCSSPPYDSGDDGDSSSSPVLSPVQHRKKFVSASSTTKSKEKVKTRKTDGEKGAKFRNSSSSSTDSSSSSSLQEGDVFSKDLLENFGCNLQRIEKDVQRCDRNYWYFTPPNLQKLRNIMCTYVWEHLDFGYLQGMCDLAAPLLVMFDEEPLTYSCFCHLMMRMQHNFPHGGQMDNHFANMRSLIQILDSEMYQLMQQNGDYTHFYFCYRWFLLDFKREMVYDDVFRTWEVIAAARQVASPQFFLFIAMALVEYYRDIILDNNMDFTDIIKFFNEMAEHHDASTVLKMARDLVLQLQTLIDDK